MITLEEALADDGVGYSYELETAGEYPVMSHKLTFTPEARQRIAARLECMPDDVPARILSMIEARFG